MTEIQQLKLNPYDEYDIYNDYDPNLIQLNAAGIQPEDFLRDPLKSSYKWKATASGKDTILQLMQNETEDTVRRPITAVHGVGFTSRSSNNMFDPLNLVSQMKSTPTDTPKEITLEDRIRNLEHQVMHAIDESCTAEYRGDFKLALEKAKEASSKEHSLIQLLEQTGHADSHNFDLTNSVLFTVAHQYVTNEMYTEALNMYKAIIKNGVFPKDVNKYIFKINIGNIYAKLGKYHEALKIYRWVLDRVPNTNKEFRIKILHNIGIVFVKMSKFDEACSNFEYILQEKPVMSAGFHAIVCHYLLRNVQSMKKSFQTLLDIPPEITEMQNKFIIQDDVDVQTEVLKRDSLSQIVQKANREAEKSIICSANLISRYIDDNYASGYNWCLDTIKNSDHYSSLSGDLEITKAIAYLRNNKSPETAIDALKSFDKRENRIASVAYTNLSFIYYLLENYESAESQASQGRECDMYSAVANVNLGNCFFAKDAFEKAKEYYNLALENDSSCIEALYNLGLAHKRTGHIEESLDCFTKLRKMVTNHPDVVYQIAHLYELSGETDQAIEWYLQLLGIIPSDIGTLLKLADIFDNENDKQQAFHYYFEAYRYCPSNLAVLDWLGEYFVELRLSEKAAIYFDKASLVQPEEPKWKLLVGSCYRQAGNYQQALRIYKKVMQQFPNNTDCLKLLIKIGRELGLKETNEYVDKLKKIEKAIAQQNSANMRRKNGGSSGSSSRASTSIGNDRAPSGSNDKRTYDISFTDPVGPMSNDRPRTSASNKLTLHLQTKDDIEFGDDELDEELLPL